MRKSDPSIGSSKKNITAWLTKQLVMTQENSKCTGTRIVGVDE